MEEEKQQEEKLEFNPTPTRREVIKYIALAGIGVSTLTPVPLIAKYITPSPKWPAEKGEIPPGPVRIGKLSDVPVGKFVKFKFNFGKALLPGAVYNFGKSVEHQKIGATQDSGRDISGGEPEAGVPEGLVAFSLKCVHLGCIINPGFKEGTTTECPCHYAHYDMAKGAAVISGPAPSPVPEIKLEVKGDEIWAVGWRDENYVKSLTVYRGLI